MIHAVNFEQDGNSVILYYNNIADRKSMLLALFAVREQVAVSIWSEDIDGNTYDHHHYTKHAGDKWVVK